MASLLCLVITKAVWLLAGEQSFPSVSRSHLLLMGLHPMKTLGRSVQPPQKNESLMVESQASDTGWCNHDLGVVQRCSQVN